MGDLHEWVEANLAVSTFLQDATRPIIERMLSSLDHTVHGDNMDLRHTCNEMLASRCSDPIHKCEILGHDGPWDIEELLLPLSIYVSQKRKSSLVLYINSMNLCEEDVSNMIGTEKSLMNCLRTAASETIESIKENMCPEEVTEKARFLADAICRVRASNAAIDVLDDYRNRFLAASSFTYESSSSGI